MAMRYPRYPRQDAGDDEPPPWGEEGDDGDGDVPTFRKGPDGRTYVWDGTKFVLAPGMDIGTGDPIVIGEGDAGDVLAPIFERLRGIVPGLGVPHAVRGVPFGTRTVDSGSPEAARAVNAARRRAIAGQASIDDLTLLDQVGENVKKYGYNLSGEGGGSGDPYAGARFAEQVRAQRIQEAQAAIDSALQRTQAAQSARLDAAQYAIPASGGFPGFNAGDPAVRAGLVPEVRPQPIGFDPERIMRQDEAGIRADLDQLRRLAGY